MTMSLSQSQKTVIFASILLVIFLGWIVLYFVIGHGFLIGIEFGKSSPTVSNRGGYKTITSSTPEPDKNCSKWLTMIGRTENETAKPGTITSLVNTTTDYVLLANGSEENVTTSTSTNVISPTIFPGTNPNLDDVTTHYGNETDEQDLINKGIAAIDRLGKQMVLDPIYAFWRIFHIIAEDLQKNKELSRRTKKLMDGIFLKV